MTTALSRLERAEFADFSKNVREAYQRGSDDVALSIEGISSKLENAIKFAWEESLQLRKKHLDAEKRSKILDKRLLGSQKAYFQEVTLLRDRIRALEEKDTTAIHEDTTFYEPLKYLDDNTKELCKDIIEEAVKKQIEVDEVKRKEDESMFQTRILEEKEEKKNLGETIAQLQKIVEDERQEFERKFEEAKAAAEAVSPKEKLAEMDEEDIHETFDKFQLQARVEELEKEKEDHIADKRRLQMVAHRQKQNFDKSEEEMHKDLGKQKQLINRTLVEVKRLKEKLTLLGYHQEENNVKVDEELAAHSSAALAMPRPATTNAPNARKSSAVNQKRGPGVNPYDAMRPVSQPSGPRSRLKKSVSLSLQKNLFRSTQGFLKMGTACATDTVKEVQDNIKGVQDDGLGSNDNDDAESEKEALKALLQNAERQIQEFNIEAHRSRRMESTIASTDKSGPQSMAQTGDCWRKGNSGHATGGHNTQTSFFNRSMLGFRVSNDLQDQLNQTEQRLRSTKNQLGISELHREEAEGLLTALEREVQDLEASLRKQQQARQQMSLTDYTKRRWTTDGMPDNNFGNENPNDRFRHTFADFGDVRPSQMPRWHAMQDPELSDRTGMQEDVFFDEPRRCQTSGSFPRGGPLFSNGFDRPRSEGVMGYNGMGPGWRPGHRSDDATSENTHTLSISASRVHLIRPLQSTSSENTHTLSISASQVQNPLHSQSTSRRPSGQETPCLVPKTRTDAVQRSGSTSRGAGTPAPHTETPGFDSANTTGSFHPKRWRSGQNSRMISRHGTRPGTSDRHPPDAVEFFQVGRDSRYDMGDYDFNAPTPSDDAPTPVEYEKGVPLFAPNDHGVEVDPAFQNLYADFQCVKDVPAPTKPELMFGEFQVQEDCQICQQYKDDNAQLRDMMRRMEKDHYAELQAVIKDQVLPDDLAPNLQNPTIPMVVTTCEKCAELEEKKEESEESEGIMSSIKSAQTPTDTEKESTKYRESTPVGFRTPSPETSLGASSTKESPKLSEETPEETSTKESRDEEKEALSQALMDLEQKAADDRLAYEQELDETYEKIDDIEEDNESLRILLQELTHRIKQVKLVSEELAHPAMDPGQLATRPSTVDVSKTRPPRVQAEPEPAPEPVPMDIVSMESLDHRPPTRDDISIPHPSTALSCRPPTVGSISNNRPEIFNTFSVPSTANSITAPSSGTMTPHSEMFYTPQPIPIHVTTGKQVNQIFESAGLGAVLDEPSVYDRLYADAAERIDRLRRTQVLLDRKQSLMIRLFTPQLDRPQTIGGLETVPECSTEPTFLTEDLPPMGMMDPSEGIPMTAAQRAEWEAHEPISAAPTDVGPFMEARWDTSSPSLTTTNGSKKVRVKLTGEELRDAPMNGTSPIRPRRGKWSGNGESPKNFTDMNGTSPTRQRRGTWSRSGDSPKRFTSPEKWSPNPLSSPEKRSMTANQSPDKRRSQVMPSPEKRAKTAAANQSPEKVRHHFSPEKRKVSQPRQIGLYAQVPGYDPTILGTPKNRMRPKDRLIPSTPTLASLVDREGSKPPTACRKESKARHLIRKDTKESGSMEDDFLIGWRSDSKGLYTSGPFEGFDCGLGERDDSKFTVTGRKESKGRRFSGDSVNMKSSPSLGSTASTMVPDGRKHSKGSTATSQFYVETQTLRRSHDVFLGGFVRRY